MKTNDRRDLRSACMGRRLVCAVLTAALLIGACSDNEPKAEVYGEGDQAVQIGGGIPDDFPDDIPVPDEATFTSGGVDSGYVFEWTATSQEVISFYEDELPGFAVEETGDEMVDEGSLDFGVIINWDNGEITYQAGEPGVLLIRTQPQG